MSTTRRRFVLGGVGALSAAVLGDAFLIEPRAIDVSRHDVPVPGLPPGLEGVRIACLTDVHLAGGVSAAARVALEVLARERPDVVVLIGDICNCQSDLPTLAAWARDARGRAATFATLGNWEHTARIDRATAERARSEEHTSELQSQSNLVCRLLLEKKKINDRSLVKHS